MKKIKLEEFITGIRIMQEEPEGCYFFKVGKTPEGRDVALVLGYVEGYDEGERFQYKTEKDIYTLCGKIAVNIDDLQCDYDFDWYMPWDKDGDIYDSETAIDDIEVDYKYFIDEIKNVMGLLKNGKLTVESQNG